MDRLWAPWRAQYIRDTSRARDSEPSCFLCGGLAAPPSTDRERLILWRGPHSVLVLNRFPYNNGHLLVAPLLHLGTLGELHGESLTEPIETIRRAIGVLDRVLSPHGYNVGLNQGRSAGAGLPGHLHWHVVPRWDGDANFMPVIGQTKVLIESLHEFYDRFLVEFSRQNGPESPASGLDMVR